MNHEHTSRNRSGRRNTLPPEQQAALVTFLSTRLARANGSPEVDGDAWVDSEQEFLRLVQQWRAETEFSSSLTEMAAHPAYQRIIGMGRLALPMIFRELVAEPDHWFWALHKAHCPALGWQSWLTWLLEDRRHCEGTAHEHIAFADRRAIGESLHVFTRYFFTTSSLTSIPKPGEVGTAMKPSLSSLNGFVTSSSRNGFS